MEPVPLEFENNREYKPKPALSDDSSSQEASITPPAPPGFDDKIPDGGLQAWLQVVGGWVVLLATWGLVNTYGVFQSHYQTVMLSSYSASTISWIGSVQACLLFFVGVVAGPLFDAGYFTATLVVGLLMVSFGMFMTSICTTYWQVLLAQGVCVGIGMGLTFLPSTAIQTQYFQKRRALAVGICGTGSPVGGIIFPIIFSRLLPKVGFGWATRVIAFIILGLSVIPIIFMRTRLPPSGRIRSFVDNTAWSDFPYMTFGVGATFVFLVLYTAFFYIQVFVELNGLTTVEFAPYTVTLLNVGSIIGRILPMWLSDKFGIINVTIICTLASAVLAFGWMGIVDLAGVIVFTLLYGITSGAVVVGAPVAGMALTPDMSRVGTRLGMTFVLAGTAVLIGTPIAGAIFGDFTRERWLGGIGYSAAGLIIGSIWMILSRNALHKKTGNWKV